MFTETVERTPRRHLAEKIAARDADMAFDIGGFEHQQLCMLAGLFCGNLCISSVI